MIASLHGRLESISGDSVVLNVSGIGFRVYLPSSTLSSLGNIGDEVSLNTHLHLREDNVALYGFTSADELRFFQTLIGVKGLGPRLALAMLSAMRLEQLTMAVATGSTELLTSIPGIGRKVADRLVLELKDKVAAGLVTAPMVQSAEDNTDVLSVLVSLGYSASEASRAVASLPISSGLSLEEKIKQALGYFAGK
ncbi:MAG: Holliday junction branch migration protein RuvA [Dehalococcoidales bacterium]|nr:Holliday junction branch migration protein RuvA [Dehalococcoidales bacterium]